MELFQSPETHALDDHIAAVETILRLIRADGHLKDFRHALGPATWNLVLDEGRLRVDLEGELAGISGPAADNKKPGSLSAAGLAEQIKLVAGTGFEPVTFRL